ncbi:CDP-diacylglycerol--glycerol-3-phosphate 3-phosphatidyltransferase [Adlercreutzia faecimuris]|uniref:CDP-diacylglycerol--glycerol-3-phosphate 3-phosphatidyltransferase n=1 Tax=Adlercreutzia faecimuris TaxID=2897341 RepID=A0ABS9WGM1_9ACTN|nr:CDP-diacylglycerol--glycerol-3-phosphate 3-phosphatidyltransferase [Adlercreutzia sp. JBNU-10]MCI2241944.1 CDP-diacylglycerol--glycerol-3-phosphate 3-phosphatidyltransferase [Adlercreutzia sp. JBNU-10]
MSAPQRAERLWTPANVVTVVRICLVPAFVVALLSPWPQWMGLTDFTDQAKSLVAAGVFILISCTDWIDGYLARSRGEVTDFGKFMDPLADKILVAAALLALVELAALPSWPVLIILAREFIVSGVRMVAASRGEVIAASWYGKAKTVFQIIAIVLFIVKDGLELPDAAAAVTSPLYVVSWAVMIVALVLTIVSMMDYLAKARHLLGFGPRAAAGAAGDDGAAGSAAVASAVGGDGLEACVDTAAREAVAALGAAGLTAATAESLTGGLIAGALTAVPGSSAVVRGGVASYAPEAKEALLGVDGRAIAHAGVVSEPVARQMAEGARARLAADVAVAVTGIAGPGGAEPGKPVGTVWMAVATADGTAARELRFDGDRRAVRLQTVERALGALARAAAGEEPLG